MTISGGKNHMPKWIKVILSVSIILNLCFLYDWSNRPTVRNGVLTRDVTVPVSLNGQQEKIVSPKGLVVKDASPQGFSRIGQFESERFSIIVTSDYKMVDYNVGVRLSGAYYPSIDPTWYNK
jgi:hypothetical protein